MNIKTFSILLLNIACASLIGILMAYATVNMIAPPKPNIYFGIPAHVEWIPA